MAKRSIELIQVGYFLSRFGQQEPPQVLGTSKWKNAYFAFYDALNEGRSILEFEHSLKNSRDTFDGHFDNTRREGWKNVDGTPVALSGLSKQVYERFRSLTEDEIWRKINRHFTAISKEMSAVIQDAISEEVSNKDFTKSKTEGGRKIIISRRVERNSFLRTEAIKIHGTDCMACGFNFEAKYGVWGAGYIEVHHIIPLSQKSERSETNPNSDLIVLCANCHRMVHRKSTMTLTIEELQAKIQD